MRTDTTIRLYQHRVKPASSHVTKFTAGLPSTGLSNATQAFKRFLVTGRQASLEQVLQRCLIGSG